MEMEDLLIELGEAVGIEVGVGAGVDIVVGLGVEVADTVVGLGVEAEVAVLVGVTVDCTTAVGLGETDNQLFKRLLANLKPAKPKRTDPISRTTHQIQVGGPSITTVGSGKRDSKVSSFFTPGLPAAAVVEEVETTGWIVSVLNWLALGSSFFSSTGKEAG
jgi:hypothetical protein